LSHPAAAFAANNQWLRAEGSRFVLYGQKSEADLKRRIRQLEIYDDTLQAATGLHPKELPPKLSIYLVRDYGDLAKAAPDMSSHIVGFYQNSVEDIFALAIDTGDHHNPRELTSSEVLFHEYAHHFMFQNFPGAYPKWYAEGFAEYVAPTHIHDDGAVDIGLIPGYRAMDLLYGSWMPLKKLLFSHDIQESDQEQFYAESWLFTHYCFSDSGRLQQLESYLAKLASGGAPEQAFADAFAASPDEMDMRLRTYSRHSLTYMTIHPPLSADESAVTITALPHAADELLMLDLRLKSDPPKKGWGDTLEEVRRRAADYPGDAYAQRVLARAEIFYGTLNAGLAIAGDGLAAAPEDPDWLYLKGMGLLRQADGTPENRASLIQDGRRYLAKANHLRPNQAPTLYHYAWSNMGAPGEPSENTANILSLALGLAPQVPEIGMATAYVHMRRGEFDQAILPLKRIAYAPHSSAELTAAALKMLEEAQAHRAAEVPSPR
jgi:hypothetical protein